MAAPDWLLGRALLRFKHLHRAKHGRFKDFSAVFLPLLNVNSFEQALIFMLEPIAFAFYVFSHYTGISGHSSLLELLNYQQ